MKKLMLTKGRAMASLMLMCLLLVQGCRKEILLQKDNNPIISSKIRNITYQEFISSINVKATGSLSNVLTGAKEKVMSTETLAGNLSLIMDSVKLLHLGDTLSYVISIKPQTPRATVFQNLTIQVVKEKTSAFLSTYYPSKEWIDSWRAGHVIAFKDKVEFNKINLYDVGLNTKTINTTNFIQENGLKGKIIASISSPSGAPNVISLAPGECEIYDIYTVVPHQCSTGDWPGSCPWEQTGIPTEGGSLPYYTLERTTGVDCAPPAAGTEGGGSSSGGSTVPTPPPGFNPCNGGTPTVSVNFEKGTRLAVLPPTPCDPIMPEGADPSFSSNAKYLFNILSISDEQRKNYLHTHNMLTNDFVAYLGANGTSFEQRNFIIWGIGYLMANSNLNPSITRLENIYQLVRLQNYRPKDREPASYYWRPKLTADNWDSYLTQSTPKYIIINGEEVKNVEAYNCHFYAFGLEYATLTDDGFPKWVLNLKLKDWEEVKGNVQVGDRIVYYQDYNGQKDWTHSGVVTEVDADGYATKVSSKMGTYQIIEHHPRDIPESYGSNLPTFLLGKEKLVTPSRIYYRKK